MPKKKRLYKQIWCAICESPQGHLFAVEDDKGKHYICKTCIVKYKRMKEISESQN